MKPKVLMIILPYLQLSQESKAGYWGEKYAKRCAPSTKMKSWPALPYGALSVVSYNKDIADFKIVDCNVGDKYRYDILWEMGRLKPDIVGFAMQFDNSYLHLAELLKLVRSADEDVITVIGGAATVPAAKEILIDNPDMRAVCFSEGELPFRHLLTNWDFEHPSWITRYSLLTGKVPQKTVVSNLDDIIELDYSFVNPANYSMREEFSPYADEIPEQKRFFIVTSRGCPYRCLAGNTIIHTINGDIPIRHLTGRKDVKVLSRDPITQKPVYAAAVNIQRTQEMADLVRVHFDDGTHIDCTPDHKFKVFHYKNQFNMTEKEHDIEAADLIPEQQVRAVRFDTQKTGRRTVSTRRDINLYHADMVMESTLERKLQSHERVHHQDAKPGNDTPDNLILTDKNNHTKLHPEVAERMRLYNPAKNMTTEWKEKISHAGKGKRRTLEQRLRYRASKLGTKNPMYREGVYHQHPGKSRIPEVNHKVVSVKRLLYRDDVYCMEVPGIHWFYANKVLVHNCSFCYRSRENDKRMRFASVDRVISHVRYLVDHYGMNVLTICDDQLLVNMKRAKELFRQLAQFNIRVECMQGESVAFIDEEMAELMHKAGMVRAVLAIESGSQWVLDRMIEKPVNLVKAKETIQILRKHGFWVTAVFVMGFPGETDEHRKETLEWIQGADLDWATFSAAVPIKGTKLYDMCVKDGYIQKDIKLGDMDFSNYFIHTPGYTPEYVARQIYNMNLQINFVENRSMRIGDYKTAIKAFKQVLFMYENHAFAHYYLAECYHRLVMIDDSIVHLATFQGIIEKDPKWAEYAKEFGLCQKK